MEKNNGMTALSDKAETDQEVKFLVSLFLYKYYIFIGIYNLKGNYFLCFMLI